MYDHVSTFKSFRMKQRIGEGAGGSDTKASAGRPPPLSNVTSSQMPNAQVGLSRGISDGSSSSGGSAPPVGGGFAGSAALRARPKALRRDYTGIVWCFLGSFMIWYDR